VGASFPDSPAWCARCTAGCRGTGRRARCDARAPARDHIEATEGISTQSLGLGGTVTPWRLHPGRCYGERKPSTHLPLGDIGEDDALSVNSLRTRHIGSKPSQASQDALHLRQSGWHSGTDPAPHLSAHIPLALWWEAQQPQNRVGHATQDAAPQAQGVGVQLVQLRDTAHSRSEIGAE
jgi:hypothetical protein